MHHMQTWHAHRCAERTTWQVCTCLASSNMDLLCGLNWMFAHASLRICSAAPCVVAAQARDNHSTHNKEACHQPPTHNTCRLTHCRENLEPDIALWKDQGLNMARLEEMIRLNPDVDIRRLGLFYNNEVCHHVTSWCHVGFIVVHPTSCTSGSEVFPSLS